MVKKGSKLGMDMMHNCYIILVVKEILIGITNHIILEVILEIILIDNS